MKRHTDALAIQQGACNPSGIAHSIVAACSEMRALPNYGTREICADPALRLMVHQLAFLCNVAEIDGTLDVYGQLTRACEDAAKPKPNRAQYRAMFKLFRRNPDGAESFREFCKRATHDSILGIWGVTWGNMYVGIERDGHSHT